jgi:type II secretory pathway pseudopilin PulG
MYTEHVEKMQRRCRRLHEVSGNSLVETLAALALFAMSTATVGDFLVSQVRAAGSNDRHTAAYGLGIQELEDLRSLPYEQITSRSEQVQKGGMVYALTTRVEDDVPGPQMKSITVDVIWDEPGGTRHVVLETIDSAVTR